MENIMLYKHVTHYFSVDIECGGPTPIKNKLLSIGASVYNANMACVDSFYLTIDDRDATFDSNTMKEFWDKQPKAYEEIKNGQFEVKTAIHYFDKFVRGFGGRPCFVANPTWFDYGWLRVYLLRYAGSDPFEMCVCDYAQQARAMGIKLKSYDNPFPHHALHDAEEQGKQFAEFVKKWQLRKQTLQNLEHRISQQKDMIKSLERKIKHINALD